ncbi:hypothetical protein Bca4012_054635 [Brassica carinata]|uniref:Uncharacterized protein n=1 Tax=Brassica carinata TaxID=52824 RepID=A0A8X7VWR8_BRACI|nr:hypothetical protein Bca52824_012324 [Brassica carinata]
MASVALLRALRLREFHTASVSASKSDQEKKQLIDIRNTADTTIYSIEKSLSEYREKITAEIASEIETAVSDLRTAMTGEEIEDIKANKAVSKIGEHMSKGSGSSGSSGGEGSSGNEQQTPEAEFEEATGSKK